MAEPLVAILLAAGEGTRMNSKIPKVLHEIAGQPMVEYALQNAMSAGASRVYAVVDSKTGEIARYLGKRVVPIVQKKKLGTGHAVQQALPFLKSLHGNVLVLCADACLVRSQTVQALRQFHRLQNGALTLLTARVEDPCGYGRILRGSEGQVERIVEEREATEKERRINEINAGVYLFKAKALTTVLKQLKPNNVKGEYYLTDTIHLVLAGGERVDALMVPDRSEVLGVNDRFQLARAHRTLNLRRIEEHQGNGVTILDGSTVEIGPRVIIGRDTVIGGNVKLSGETVLGEDCLLEPGSFVDSSVLGRGVTVKASRIVESHLGDHCDAGPFAHIRGGSRLGAKVHVGTNTELKNARIGNGSKVGHFSYVGDAVLGKDVNVGAGCVFANFDGKKKHETRVGDGAFLGSNSTLVAPVRIGPKSVVGAGAVVTRDVPARTTVVGVPAKLVKKH